MNPAIGAVVHRAPGRLRVRVPARQGDRAWFAELAPRLSALPGVRSVEVNPLTAGVLLRIDVDPAAVEEALAGVEGLRVGTLAEGRAEHVALLEAAAPEGTLLDRVGDALAEIDADVLRTSRGRLDAGSLAFVGLLGAAAVQALRGRVLPPALPLFSQAIKLAQDRRKERAHET